MSAGLTVYHTALAKHSAMGGGGRPQDCDAKALRILALKRACKSVLDESTATSNGAAPAAVAPAATAVVAADRDDGPGTPPGSPPASIAVAAGKPGPASALPATNAVAPSLSLPPPPPMPFLPPAPTSLPYAAALMGRRHGYEPHDTLTVPVAHMRGGGGGQRLTGLPTICLVRRFSMARRHPLRQATWRPHRRLPPCGLPTPLGR